MGCNLTIHALKGYSLEDYDTSSVSTNLRATTIRKAEQIKV